MHYSVCETAGGADSGVTDGSADCEKFVEGADAIGDLIEGSTRELSRAEFNIGGRENEALAASGQIFMDSAELTPGTPTVEANGKPQFTTVNATELTDDTLTQVGTRYTVNASIIASNGI
ncbi:TPA: hypothetical protein ACX6SN_001073 [Photobacterium damselae]